MRIIAGRLRHRLLMRPNERTTRPTTDRVRESIFNILCHKYCLDFSGIKILDAFAGSGAMGLEALSRGAQHVFFVEKDRNATSILQKNVNSLKVNSEVTIYQTDILKLGHAPGFVGLIFLDPPYHAKLLEPTCAYLKATNWIQARTLLCIESSSNDIPDSLPNLVQLEQRVFGQTAVSFWFLAQQEELVQESF